MNVPKGAISESICLFQNIQPHVEAVKCIRVVSNKIEAMPSTSVAWMGQQLQISNRNHLARVKTRIWEGGKRRKPGPLYSNLKGHNA